MKTLIISLFVVAASLPTLAQEVDPRSYSELHYAVKLTKHPRVASNCAATKIGPKEYLTHAFCTRHFLAGASSSNVQVLVPGDDPVISYPVTSSLYIGVFDMINRRVDYVETKVASIRYVKSSFTWMITALVALEKDEEWIQPEPTPINAAIITVEEETFIPSIEINEIPNIKFDEQLLDSTKTVQELINIGQKIIVSSTESSSPYNPTVPRAAMAAFIHKDGEYGGAVLLNELIMGQSRSGYGGAVWAINEETQQLQFAGLTTAPLSHPSIFYWSMLNEQMMQLIHLK